MAGRRPKIVNRMGELVEDTSLEDKNSLGQVNPVQPVPTPEQIIDEEMKKRQGRFIPD